MGVLTSIEGSNPSFSASPFWPGGLRPAEPATEPPPSRPWPGSVQRAVPLSTVPPDYADPRTRQKGEVPCPAGGVAERSNAAVSKTVSGLWVRRGFKSLPLRLVGLFSASLSGMQAFGRDPRGAGWPDRIGLVERLTKSG